MVRMVECGCGPRPGLRPGRWPTCSGNLDECLQLGDENGFPVTDLVKAVNQVLGMALEMQGFEVLPLDTEILVRPGSTTALVPAPFVPDWRPRL